MNNRQKLEANIAAAQAEIDRVFQAAKNSERWNQTNQTAKERDAAWDDLFAHTTEQAEADAAADRIKQVERSCSSPAQWNEVQTLVEQHSQPQRPKGWTQGEVKSGLAYEQALMCIKNGWANQI